MFNNTNAVSLDDLVVRVRSNTYRQPNSAKRLQQQQQLLQQQQEGGGGPASPTLTVGGKSTATTAAGAASSSTTNASPLLFAANSGTLRDPVVANPDLLLCDPEVLMVMPPGDTATSRRSEYLACFTTEYEFSNVPKCSEHGVNPERHYDLQVAGQRHVEGGWPRDCDASDPEHRMRHLRRTRKEASFLATVRELVGKAVPILQTNNAIDIYHSMFSDILEGRLGEGSAVAALAGGKPADDSSHQHQQQSSSSKNADGDYDLDDLDDSNNALSPSSRGGGGDDDDDDFDDDEDGIINDHHGADDSFDGSGGGGGGRRKKKSQRRREQEKELAAKRAQNKAEELQIAALAGRTVALNATGVFRDAPRAFPGELLGSGVKDLVRAEQRKLMEQRLHEMDREAQKKDQQQKEQHQQEQAQAQQQQQRRQSMAAGSTSNNNIPREQALKNAMKNVVLGPTAAFSDPKVVSSLSWVSHLDIPGCPGTGAGSTTLAIALASVSHTPHLSLLLGRSTATQQQLRAAIAHRRSSLPGGGSSGDFSTSGSGVGGVSFGGSASFGSSTSDIMMSGVDLFPTSLIYDAASPQAPLLRLQTASDLTQIEFSPRDLPLLAAGSSDGTLSLFDLRRGQARCLVVADVCNAAGAALGRGGGSPQQQMFGGRAGGGATAAGLNAAAAASRRNPLNPVTSLRWVPSGTGSKCSEFVTADLSPIVRVWDTRFLSRGCLDVFNLSSGAVLGAMQEAGLDVGGLFGRNGGKNDGLVDSDDEHEASNTNNAGNFFSNTNPNLLHRAVSIDVQHVSGRIYIGTTDGKVFAFNRKGRTDSDRLCGVYQIVPREVVFAGAEVYVHVAAHPTLPRCFAAATEWGVQVYADDLSRPVARLPPSSLHGVPTSIRWVPHCAALLCVSRISGAVELWDVVVMLTSAPTSSGAGMPKAQTRVMQYSQQDGGSSNNDHHSSTTSQHGARLVSSTSAIAAASGPPISALRFSPGGTHLVAGLLDGSATLLDVTVNDEPSLVAAAEQAAAACGPKGAAPVTGARALELTCFGRVLERHGAMREARLLQLQQSGAPDSTQSSNFMYSESTSSSSSAAAMSNEKLTMDMARLSQQFQQAVVTETSSTVTAPVGHHPSPSSSSTITTTVVAHSVENQQQQLDKSSSWIPPFRSVDSRAARVMERVGNILYNANAFTSPSPSALLNASSIAAGGLESPFSASGGGNSALAAPPAVDEAAVKQVARAIETGVAVPPERSVAARRWSTVKRNLLPARPKTAGGGDSSSASSFPGGAQSARRSSADFGSASSLPSMQQGGSGSFSARPPSAPRRPRSVAVKIEHDEDD